MPSSFKSQIVAEGGIRLPAATTAGHVLTVADASGNITAQAPAGGGSGPTIEQTNLNRYYPYVEGTIQTVTPTQFTQTVCRVFPFQMEAMVLNQIYLKTVTALAAAFEVGIYNSAGTRVYASGTQAAVANGTAISVSALSLPAGQYYFGVVTKAASTTTVFHAPANFPAGYVPPRWGTVATTAGALPASITPSAITETVGPHICFVTLSNWST